MGTSRAEPGKIFKPGTIIYHAIPYFVVITKELTARCVVVLAVLHDHLQEK